MCRSFPVPSAYCSVLLEKPGGLSALIVAASLPSMLVPAAILYYLYAASGDPQLLAVALILAALAPLDAAVMWALFRSVIDTLRSMVLELVSKLSPHSYGVAVDAGLAAVVSLDTGYGLVAARLAGKAVEVVIVERPRLLETRPWPRIPVRLLKTSFKKLARLAITGCATGSWQGEARLSLPSPVARELWVIEGKARYYSRRCPYQVGVDAVQEALAALSLAAQVEK